MLLVGESAQENWDLLERAKKQGWFFHLTDFPSPYVVLESGKVEPNAHIKLRCAEICVEHSKYKNSGKVKVDVTPCGNVKLDKKDAIGECDYKNEGKVEILVVEGCRKTAPAASSGQEEQEEETGGNGNASRAAAGKRVAGRSAAKGSGGRGVGYNGGATGSAAEAAVVDGEHVSVRKSAAGGWATIVFRDAAVRAAVLRSSGAEVAVKGGVAVRLQPQVDPKTKVEVPTELFATWGRKVEEKTPVPSTELARCFDELAKRASSAVARAAPVCAEGAQISVRKAAAGGVAVVSFLDASVRDAVLALSEGQVRLSELVIAKLQPQMDPKTKEEVKTDLFMAWGRKVEEKTPVSETEILAAVEELAAATVSKGSSSIAATEEGVVEPE